MRIDRSSFVSLIFLTLFLTVIPVAAHAADSSGTDYWVTFPRNVPPEQKVLLMISSRVATTGLVSNPALAIEIPFAVVPGTTTVVELPHTVILNENDTVENKGVHITSLAPVVVYGTNSRAFTGDAYLALPVDALGTNYMIMAWDTGLGAGTELSLVATQNDTHVTITPTTNAGSRVAGVPFVLTMQQGQTYTLSAFGGVDLTGSTIVADKPVAVYGGHSCGLVPEEDIEFCDYLVEQMFPVSTLGTSFVTVPYEDRTSGYVVRVLASQDDTVVSIGGGVVATIDAGEFYQATSLFVSAYITTSRPATVAQYSKGLKTDNLTGDPHEMLILPASSFLSSYLISTAATGVETHYLNIVAPSYAVGTVTLDGISIGAAFEPVEGSGYSAAQIEIAPGDHTIDAAVPIGVYVYGFRPSESYGYPGGALTAPLATNLSIQKTAGPGPVLVSGPVSYTIVVSNSGPDTAIGAIVTDDFPAALTNVTWTCAPSAGATCTAAGAGDLQDVVTIPAGGTVTYSVTATAPAAPANVSNTATVTPPANATDPAQANNSSTAEVPVVPAPAAPAEPIPTASEWALILLGLAMSLAGVLTLHRT